jgi:hypothetical protein
MAIKMVLQLCIVRDVVSAQLDGQPLVYLVWLAVHGGIPAQVVGVLAMPLEL